MKSNFIGESAPGPVQNTGSDGLGLVPLPCDHAARLTLFSVRRIAGHGLRDAQAASRMMAAFGLPFRRPLVLMRTTMFELSRASQKTIRLAPCCFPRMTSDEATLLAAFARARLNEPAALANLHALAGEDAALAGTLCAAAAYSWALADLGCPLPDE